MSGIVQGLGDLVSSILEIFKGIFDAIFSAIHQVFALFASLVSNAVGAMEGMVGFILGNIFIIGTLAAVFFAFAYYRARQGNPVVVNGKKLQ